MVDFHGWDAGTLWDERLAMVHDKKWAMAVSAFCRPFTTALDQGNP